MRTQGSTGSLEQSRKEEEDQASLRVLSWPASGQRPSGPRVRRALRPKRDTRAVRMVTGPGLSPLHIDSINPHNLMRYDNYLLFHYGETKAQRDKATCPGSHSQTAAEPGFEPWLTDLSIFTTSWSGRALGAQSSPGSAVCLCPLFTPPLRTVSESCSWKG